MATQFYKTLEDILKLKEENAQQIQTRLSEHTIDKSYDDELAGMRKLAGLDGTSASEFSIEDKFIDKSKRLEFIKENNIKPGSPRWFKVMYAKPELTGEDPFGE